MTFAIVTGVIVTLGGAITSFLFRKGGPWNPVESKITMDYTTSNVPSLDRIGPQETVVPSSVPAPQAPTARPAPPIDRIKLCAQAQQAFEGWYPGSNSFKHLNPGNCKGLDGMFITFKTYEAGFAYLEDYIRRVATGKHHAYPKGGATTISQYTHTYTSDPEPSATNYAAAISRAVGLPVDSPMSALLS